MAAAYCYPVNPRSAVVVRNGLYPRESGMVGGEREGGRGGEELGEVAWC